MRYTTCGQTVWFSVCVLMCACVKICILKILVLTYPRIWMGCDESHYARADGVLDCVCMNVCVFFLLHIKYISVNISTYINEVWWITLRASRRYTWLCVQMCVRERIWILNTLVLIYPRIWMRCEVKRHITLSASTRCTWLRVCIQICVCVNFRVCVKFRVCVRVRAYQTFAYKCVCMRVCKCVCANVCMRVYMRVYVSACVRARVYMRVCVCVYRTLTARTKQKYQEMYVCVCIDACV